MSGLSLGADGVPAPSGMQWGRDESGGEAGAVRSSSQRAFVLEFGIDGRHRGPTCSGSNVDSRLVAPEFKFQLCP